MSELLAKATKRAQSSAGFFSFSASSKYDDAHELYTAAANQFTIEKNYKQAGDAYAHAADMALLSTDLKDDAASDFWKASKAYKKTHPQLAVGALERTIQLLKQKGNFRQAADRQKDLANIHLQEGGELELALHAFEEAAELYSAEDATATANGCYKEAADLAATLDLFERAIKHYELVANASLHNPMTKYGVKEFYLKAGMCHLATGDVVTTRRALESYANADNSFPTTREYKFLLSIIDAFDAGDSELFVGAVQEFDRLTKLDNWKTSLLLKIKKGIAEEPGLT